MHQAILHPDRSGPRLDGQIHNLRDVLNTSKDIDYLDRPRNRRQIGIGFQSESVNYFGVYRKDLITLLEKIAARPDGCRAIGFEERPTIAIRDSS